MKELRKEFEASLSVLILSTKFGAGHTSVSEALRKSFASHSVFDVDIRDYYELASPSYNRFSRFIYKAGITWTPTFYGAAYYSANAIPPDSPLFKIPDSFGRRKLAALLKEERPDVVICTYPTPVGVLSVLKDKAIFQGFLATVITDYEAHSGWIRQRVDLYLVADADIRQNLISRGLDQSSIEITGIPIDSGFGPIAPVPRDKYGLPADKPVVLFIAHAYRSSEVIKITRILQDKVPEVHLAILCGRREDLTRRLQPYSDTSRVSLFDFVDRLNELMKMCDVLVSKAGGITMTEALASRLPIVVYRPIPGQERENARFLERQGAAVLAYKPEDLARQVKSLATDRKKVASIKHSAGRIAFSGSADRAVEAILSRFKKHSSAISNLEDVIT
jgi:processive 1,2-diacylglycerol beta-glucosyltransferase